MSHVWLGANLNMSWIIDVPNRTFLGGQKALSNQIVIESTHTFRD